MHFEDESPSVTSGNPDLKREALALEEWLNTSGLNWIGERTGLLVLSGSRAYGTAVEGSDSDYKGVCVPPARYFIGMEKFEQAEFSEPDAVIYDLRKFLKLAAECNPNIIEMLFCAPEDVLLSNDLGDCLRLNREAFLSLRARYTFAGYAHSQLTRLRNHYRRPSESRNPIRAELENRFGYDTKHAMHLVRLLRMAHEILGGRGVVVKRPDAEELISIRNGAWSFEKLIAYAEEMENGLELAYTSSSLPSAPDWRVIEGISMRFGVKAVLEIAHEF